MVKNLFTNQMPKHKNIKNIKIQVKQILSTLDIRNSLKNKPCGKPQGAEIRSYY